MYNVIYIYIYIYIGVSCLLQWLLDTIFTHVQMDRYIDIFFIKVSPCKHEIQYNTKNRPLT